MPLVLKELASSDATNRRNAAFCAGELCKNGGAIALRYPCSLDIEVRLNMSGHILDNNIVDVLYDIV